MRMMGQSITALLAGLMFGLGLSVSGMLNPSKVLAFLDVAGAWDPSLAFVLAGAVMVSAVGYLIRARARRPLFADDFNVPASPAVDAKLVIGATLFGVGWGLAGFCPGPALAGLILGKWQIVVFVTAMLAGMGVYEIWRGRSVGVAAA